MKKLLQTLILFLTFSSLSGQTEHVLAFPGAEGFGKYATGGRGGLVYRVTNLNDRGIGSLRWALEARVPRIVVFEVSGNIELESNLSIRYGHLTIAGQTAPGEGITLKNYPLIVRNSENIIIRYIRSRLGDEKFAKGNALTIRADSNGRPPENIIVDHCSFSWGTDQTMSIGNSRNITIQNSIISEGLNNSIHEEGNHGLGSLMMGQNISLFKVIWSSFTHRNPQIQQGNMTGTSFIDMRNCVVYNWGSRAIEFTRNSNANIVNSYFKPGPATSQVNFANGNSSRRFLNVLGSSVPPEEYGKLFLDGNFLPTIDLSPNQWAGVRNENSNLDLELLKNRDSNGNLIPFFIPENLYSITLTAEEAFEDVLNNAGASFKRDLIDQRIIEDVRSGTSTFRGSKTGIFGIIDSQNDVGGWPLLQSLPAPLDTDRDGMPDAWEIAHGLDPFKRDNNDYDLDPNYTNLEVYLNSLVSKH